MTSRWFPPMLAVLAVAFHIALIGYDYWAAVQNERHFDVRAFLRRDLERPLFEPYGFCGAWVTYTTGQSVALGAYFPAYLATTAVQSLVNRRATCLDATTTPRGQIVTTGFALLLWFIVGLTIRRLAQRRWRKTAGGLSRTLIYAGIILFPIAVFTLLAGFLGVFVRDFSISFRLAGIAFWMFYVSILSAERLRLWRFKGI